VTVKITAAVINHGDITFLKLPGAASGASAAREESVWGSSAAGIVTRIGAEVPERYIGRKVTIYRSLQRGKALLGLWCETAQIPYQACLLLPDHVDARDYSGSLVNVVTAYAFLEQVVSEGHHGIVVTAGRSATGRAMTFLARRRNIPTLIIVRSSEPKAEMLRGGVQHVLASYDPDFMQDFENTTRTLGTTAVFDGVGGAFISQLLPALPLRSNIYFYSFLSGSEKVSFHSAVFMMKDLTMRKFSNFESATVRDGKSLMNMLEDLESCIEGPLLRTLVGQDFDLAEFDAAMEYKGVGGRKAVFVPSKYEA
jgi:NADPH2:quinone reductase